MGVENPERRGARRPTMREVAAVAGVSLSTVSRVVNGGEGVRADLAVRVRDAVELLGYRHNLTASALRRADGSSASIGLIVEDVSNPFFGAVHRGVEDVGAGARHADAGGLLRRGARARARARRGVRRARDRRADPRHRGRRQLVPDARAGGGRGAGVRRPAAAVPRRRHGRHRQRGRRARWRSSTCSRRATGGSASSATGPTSTPPPSGSGATGRRSRVMGSKRNST